MTTPSFGYTSQRPNDDEIPLLPMDFSKVAFVSTSADANATTFPLNKVVRFQSSDPILLNLLGTGELRAALRGLNDQLGGKGADVMVVRVAEGTAADAAAKLAETFASIVGDAGAGTGLWALRRAGQDVKAIPRIIACPGYTWQEIEGANPVRIALETHLAAFKAISFVTVDFTSKEASIAARETMTSDRMQPLGVAAKVFETINGASTLVVRDMAPRICGLVVAADANYRDGKPFDSWCNKPVLGIADISRPLNYALDDGSTEAQVLLAADVAVVVAGATADDGAIADGGFTYIGVESAATGDLWSQMHQVRAADYIDLEIAKITRQFLGGRITPRKVEAWLKSVDNLLIDHVNDEDILGFQRNFPREINSIEDLRLGTLSFETKVEPTAIFRRANNTIRRYRPAVEALLDAIQARAGTASAVIR